MPPQQLRGKFSAIAVRPLARSLDAFLSLDIFQPCRLPMAETSRSQGGGEELVMAGENDKQDQAA